MCGLFGVCGPGVSISDLRALRELCYISATRGTHATGLLQGLATKKSLKYFIEKSAHEANYFMWYHDNHENGNKKVMDDIIDNIFMGHVRYATQGSLTHENAHPFDTGRYVSAHNGTLFDKKYDHETKTDSQMMFEEVEEHGLFDVLRELEDKSAYAITSFDKKTRQLSFVTNGKRPLVYCYLKNRRVFYWASEKRFLDFVLHNISEKSEIFKFSEGMIYSFRPEDVNAGRSPDWVVQKIKKEKEVTTPVVSGFRIGERFYNSKGESIPRSTDTARNNIVKISENRSSLKHLTDTASTRERVRRANLLRRRCIYCAFEMDLLAQYEGIQIDTDTYACKDCKDIQEELNRQVSIH